MKLINDPEAIQQAWNGMMNLVKTRQVSLTPAVGKFSTELVIHTIRKELLGLCGHQRWHLLKVEYGYKDALEEDEFINSLCDHVACQLKMYPL